MIEQKKCFGKYLFWNLGHVNIACRDCLIRKECLTDNLTKLELSKKDIEELIRDCL